MTAARRRQGELCDRYLALVQQYAADTADEARIAHAVAVARTRREPRARLQAFRAALRVSDAPVILAVAAKPPRQRPLRTGRGVAG